MCNMRSKAHRWQGMASGKTFYIKSLDFVLAYSSAKSLTISNKLAEYERIAVKFHHEAFF